MEEVGDAVRAWLDSERPVYGVFPVHDIPPSPWPDLAFLEIRPELGLVAILPGPLPRVIPPEI